MTGTSITARARFIRILLTTTIGFFAATTLAGEHAFSVRDSIEMMRFTDPPRSESTAQAKVSPNGKWSAVVTSRGLLQANQVESTLWIFDTAAVRRFLIETRAAIAPTPRALATLAAVPRREFSASYEPIITEPRWSANSEVIFFLGQNSNGQRQLYRVQVSTGAMQPLTPEYDDVGKFDLAEETVVYTFASARTRVTQWSRSTSAERSSMRAPVP